MRGEEERAKRKKRDLRRAKALDARADRFAWVTLILDRETGKIDMEHPFLSQPEAFGVIEAAEVRMRDRMSMLQDDDSD